MKKQKILPALLGILMIVFGCLVLFDTLSVSPRMWLLSVIGAAILFFAVKVKNKVLGDIGVVALILGIAVIVNEIFIHPIYSRTFYLAATSVAVYVLAILRKNGWLTLLGTFALLISGIMLLGYAELPNELKTAYTLILVATSLIVPFTVKSDVLGYVPLVISILCYLMSLPHFLVYAGYINHNIAQIISSALLILFGVLIVIFVYKKTAKENESE